MALLRGTLGYWVAGFLTVGVLHVRPASAEQDDKVVADALFRAGREALDAGAYEKACEKFDESLRLDPAIGTKFNLANCREKLGQFATAWVLYVEVIEQLDDDDERMPFARKRADAVEPRVPRLTIELEGEVPDGTVVLRDDVELRRASLGTALPVDPGEHMIVVRAPNRRDETFEETIGEGERKTVRVSVGAVSDVPSTHSATPDGGDRGAATEPAEEASLSHAWQLGLVVRSDVDLTGTGAVGAAGASIGLGDYVELAVTGLVGSQQGVEPSVTVFILTEHWKPRLLVAAPIFFVDGTQPGVRGAAGIQWDPSRHMGVFVDVGAAYFPGDIGDLDSVVPLASLGVQGRL